MNSVERLQEIEVGLPYKQEVHGSPQFEQHERIAAYWLLVSAFEHVNRPNPGDALNVITDARCEVLAELPSDVAWSLCHDTDRHEAIADRRRHLMRLEFKAGAK